MGRSGWPVARAGQKIGLLGGSFDPPHEGHVHITQRALQCFGLDKVWWLVSPGNPLKAHGPAPMDQRLEAARTLLRHPRAVVTDLECSLGTRYTSETIHALQRAYPGVRFCWLMGADNLAQIHMWECWQSIFEQVPIGVVARSGAPMSARLSRAARIFRGHRLRASQSQLLAQATPPAWVYLHGPRVDRSSTEIRNTTLWNRGGAENSKDVRAP